MHRRHVRRGLLAVATLWLAVAGGCNPTNAGVLLDQQIPAAVRSRFSDGILRPGETLAAYTDVSALGDGSEWAAITDLRVLSHVNGTTIDVDLLAITEVERVDDGIGETMIVSDNSGVRLKIVLPNDPAVFAKVLDGKRKADPRLQ